MVVHKYTFAQDSLLENLPIWEVVNNTVDSAYIWPCFSSQIVLEIIIIFKLGLIIAFIVAFFWIIGDLLIKLSSKWTQKSGNAFNVNKKVKASVR